MALSKQRRPIVTKLLNVLLWLNGSRKIYDSVRMSNWLIDSLGVVNALPYRVPRFLSKGWEKTIVADTICYIKNGPADHTIFFLHGGGYTVRPTLFHFTMMDEIHKLTGATIVFPLYPLSPNDNYRTCYQRVTAIYKETAFLGQGQCMTLMGDSAGGGLSLGLYLHLHEQGIPVPDRLVLIAPWLDITLKNPDIKAIERKDRMLGPIGLIEFGKRWADGDDRNQYRLSPINGDLSLVDKILIVAGTRDILYPDAKLLADKLQAFDKPVEFITGAKMPHDYPLMPIPEAKKAVRAIAQFITNGSCRIHHNEGSSL
jgi:acetyl esterase/lipase